MNNFDHFLISLSVIGICSLRKTRTFIAFSFLLVGWVVKENIFYSSYILVYYPPLNIWSANTPSYYIAHLIKRVNPSVMMQLLHIKDVQWCWAFWVYLLFRVDQIQSSQIIESEQLNQIHYCKALISWLQVLWGLPYSVGNSLNWKNLTSLIFVKALKTLQSMSGSHLSPLAPWTPSVSFPQMTVDCWREEVTNGWIKILHTRYENMAYHQHYRLLKWVWKSRELEIWKLTVFSKK